MQAAASSENDPPRFRGHALALALIVLASLAFRLYVAERCSLWLDEVWTRHDSAAAWPDLLHGPSREHPPLMYVLVRLTMDVLGTSDLAVRAVSLFFGSVLLVAVDLLCLELAFTATEALVVVVGFALAPFFLRHAIEARQYALLAACTTLAFYFVLRLLRKPGDFPALVGFAISAAAAAATHYFGLAYASALFGALTVGTFPTWRERVRPWRVPLRVVLALTGLFLVLAAVALRALWLAHFYSTHTIGPPARDLEGTILFEFSFIHGRPAWLVLQAVIAALGLVIIGARLKGLARLLPLALGVVPCGIALLVSTGHAVAARYLAPSFVLYQIGAAATFLAAARAIRGGSTRAMRLVRAVVAAPLVLVPLGLRLASYPDGYGAGHAYYAGLQHYVAQNRARGTALVVFPNFPGTFIVNEGYPVNVPVVALDEFTPVPGVKRYLVAEFERSNREREFERLLLREFHLTLKQWRALPAAHLERTRFQLPVRVAGYASIPERRSNEP